MSNQNQQITHHLIGMEQGITAVHALGSYFAAIADDEPMSGDDMACLMVCVYEKLKQHQQALTELIAG